ncbi:MAG: tRNA dihydrouridine synthase DusB [Neisseriaceae bacterium]|nr:tRNA dihydrouridine synthase DusB [Neisseriaceae bacterium]
MKHFTLKKQLEKNMAFSIGSFQLNRGLALSPMAGITDNPFRKICREFGADWVVGEMISGDPTLRHTHKTLHRISHTGEEKPIVMQILGNQPQKMAEAAQFYEKIGADVIDINIGCPAKKVCHTYAGSALMQNETLVAEILDSVVSAVNIPVTLKTRLGWNDDNLNVLTIAKIAQEKGISAIAIHGRSRTQMYRGEAKYDLIKEVKKEVSIPVWVNGDITTPQKAIEVLAYTGADGVMIGRGAQGQPWLFQEIRLFMEEGRKIILPFDLISRTIKRHLSDIYAFYGDNYGHKIARKHIGWYLKNLTNDRAIKNQLFTLDNSSQQFDMLCQILQQAEVEDYYYRYRSTYLQD